MNKTGKLWFNIGPYGKNFVGFAYSTRKEALTNADVNEQTIGITLNRTQISTLTTALKTADAQLG